MPSVRDNGTFSTRDSNSYYGLGVIVEATNETSEILTGAYFEGSLRFVNGDREIDCKFGPDNLGDYYSTYFSLSYNDVPADAKTDPVTGEKPPAWRNESGSTNEAVWRPGERIRLMARRDCSSVVIADVQPTAVKGKLVIKANKDFVKSYSSEFDAGSFDLALAGEYVRIRDKASGYLTIVPVREEVEGQRAPRLNVLNMVTQGDANAPVVPLSHLELRYPVRYTRVDFMESAPFEFDLPPSVMTLQMVKLPAGDLVHASGNVLVYPNTKEGKVVYQDMAKAKLNLLEATREDVPATMPSVSFSKNELSGSIKTAVITDYVGDLTLNKGQKKLSVTWALNLRGDDIDRRLRVPFDIAKSEYERAKSSADGVDQNDKAAVADAKSSLSKAETALSAAETKYKSASKGEREKLAKAFVCGEIKVATNRGTKGPSNAKAASEACKALVNGANDAEVTITYTLDRYELPVALVYSLGSDFTWSAIASAPLLKLEPR